MKILTLACLATIVCATSTFAAEAKTTPKAKAKRGPSPTLVQIEDVPGLPRVLLIGDSISMGYTLPVRELLKGKANVHRIPINGGNTIKGLESMKEWLGTSKWDVIHFNWGLHDLKYMDKDSKSLVDRSVAGARQQVPLAEYEKNLTTLVAQLKATGAAVIWCNTTPVPAGTTGRVPGDEVKYNEVAAKVMKAASVSTNDLWTHANAKLKDAQLPANVHFSAEGSQYLAVKVAAEIEKLLPKK